MFNILKGQENLSLRTKIRQQHKNDRDPISPKELTESELRLFKWCQQTIDVDKLDKKLIPSKDEHGLLRAHGRLENIRTLPDEMRNPIILPKSHRLVELLLVHLHGKRAHCGYKSLIYEIKKAILECGSTSHGKTSHRKMCDLQGPAKEAIGRVNGPDS